MASSVAPSGLRHLTGDSLKRELMPGMVDRIVVDPDVMLGKPVIRGTRITVELILRNLSEGASEAELLEAYPHLTATDIRSAIKCALQLVERSWSSRASRQ